MIGDGDAAADRSTPPRPPRRRSATVKPAPPAAGGKTTAEAGVEPSAGASAERAPDPARSPEPPPESPPDSRAEPTATRPTESDLAAVTRPLPELGRPPGEIGPHDPMTVAGRKAMWVHVDRLLKRELATREPDKPDDLRRYRVAARRLRAALRMFASAYPDRQVRPIRRGLSELADTVGAVRDLDLRIADLNGWAMGRGDGATIAVAQLLGAWGEARAHALATLRKRLDSRRHRRLLGDLVDFVDEHEAGRRAPRDAPGSYAVGDRVASMLWSRYEDVRAFAPVVRWADVETLHRLRISVKRLRDSIEFVAPIVGPERPFLVERLVALQDHLGSLNDAAVTASAVRAFLEDRHARLAPDEQATIAAYLSDRERQVARLRRGAVARWRPVAGIGFARRLARTVVIPAGVAR